MENKQSVLRTRLRAVIEEEFYESVAVDGGFFHSVPDEWWDARTDAILAAIEEGRQPAKFTPSTRDLRLDILVDVMQREGIVIAPSNLIAIEAEYNRALADTSTT